MSAPGPSEIYFASNLDDSRDEGVCNGAADYLSQLAANAEGRELRVLRVGVGWRWARVREFWRLRAELRAALVGGARVTVEGYKAALFCLCLRRQIRRAGPDQLSFVIHDAGSRSHLRIAGFWARRANPRVFYRLYRAGLDTLAEGMVLRGRPVVVVSQAEAAKVTFSSRITVVPPNGMRNPATEPAATPLTGPADVVLYADLQVAHLRHSTLEGLRALARTRQPSPRRLVILGRRRTPERLLRIAQRAFAGGVLDAVYAPGLRQALASAGLVWLPDLVGSGVKNRTLDALRYSPQTLATRVALEGIDPAPERPTDPERASRLTVYRSPADLPAALSACLSLSQS